uniref:Poly(A)-specific ribonuclease PARN-like domain-containing protein 1 n=1 Tax=Lygus hesperus TaxID=30085 RepID=A0A0A9XY88_LYGHE
MADEAVSADRVEYVARPYNCYVFPNSVTNNGPIITLEVSSIEFNNRYNMNWNRWIREGIPYVKQEEEEKLCSSESRVDVKFPDGGFIYNTDERRSRKSVLTEGDRAIVAMYVRECKHWIDTTLQFLLNTANSVTLVENFLRSSVRLSHARKTFDVTM